MSTSQQVVTEASASYRREGGPEWRGPRVQVIFEEEVLVSVMISK